VGVHQQFVAWVLKKILSVVVVAQRVCVYVLPGFVTQCWDREC
jgi:hypothetical protein